MIYNGKAIAFNTKDSTYRVQTLDAVPVILKPDFATADQAIAWAITGQELTQPQAQGMIRMAERDTATKRFETAALAAIDQAMTLLGSLLALKTAYDNGVGDIVNATAAGAIVADTIFVKERLLALHELTETLLTYANTLLPTAKVTPIRLLNSI